MKKESNIRKAASPHVQIASQSHESKKLNLVIPEKSGIIKITPFKIIIFILVISILSYAVHYLFPIMKNIATPEGQIEFKETITNSRFGGIFMLFGLQLAQIFLVILPR